jgi:hypothetical protein
MSTTRNEQDWGYPIWALSSRSPDIIEHQVFLLGMSFVLLQRSQRKGQDVSGGNSGTFTGMCPLLLYALKIRPRICKSELGDWCTTRRVSAAETSGLPPSLDLLCIMVPDNSIQLDEENGGQQIEQVYETILNQTSCLFEKCDTCVFGSSSQSPYLAYQLGLQCFASTFAGSVKEACGSWTRTLCTMVLSTRIRTFGSHVCM